MNHVNLIGRVGQEIELRETANGKSVCSFSLAVTDDYDREKTHWFTVTAWGKTAELLTQHPRKGQLLGVSGRLVTRAWQDQQGAQRQTTEVVADRVDFLQKREDPLPPQSHDRAPVEDGGDLPF